MTDVETLKSSPFSLIPREDIYMRKFEANFSST
jgi:hypothetical protein